MGMSLREGRNRLRFTQVSRWPTEPACQAMKSKAACGFLAACVTAATMFVPPNRRPGFSPGAMGGDAILLHLDENLERSDKPRVCELGLTSLRRIPHPGRRLLGQHQVPVHIRPLVLGPPRNGDDVVAVEDVGDVLELGVRTRGLEIVFLK